MLCCIQVHAQTLKVSGIIQDSQGEPVIGATVLEIGTQNGIVSDMDGRFTLTTARNATLQISFVGYQTQEVKAATNMLIVMKDDTEILDEVVVIGYGTARKKI